AMDPPKHEAQRKIVSPSVAPSRLRQLEPLIRARICRALDELPIGQSFDWVDRVSIELTGQMLATLFDFPFEDRRKLTYWSDCAVAPPDDPRWTPGNYEAEFKAIMGECAEYFTRLWNDRVNSPPRNDLISMLAHGAATRDMAPLEYLGNVLLLI